MFPWILVGAYFLFSGFLAFLIGSDAQRRGLKPGEVLGWSMTTFIFSILPVLLYAVMVVPKTPMVRFSCPKCGKPIQPDWKFCPHCGYRREQI